MCNFKGILIISVKMKNLLFLGVLLFGIQLTAQESLTRFSTPKDSLSFTHKNFKSIQLTKHLQNIGFGEQNDLYYFPIRETVSNYRFNYTANDVAQYLFVERPLLQRLNPNYNYLGGNLSDWNNDYIPSPKEIQPR